MGLAHTRTLRKRSSLSSPDFSGPMLELGLGELDDSMLYIGYLTFFRLSIEHNVLANQLPSEARFPCSKIEAVARYHGSHVNIWPFSSPQNDVRPSLLYLVAYTAITQPTYIRTWSSSVTRLLQEGYLDVPTEIIEDLISLPTANCFNSALAALKTTERFANFPCWSHWEHLNFLDAVANIWICRVPGGQFCLAISYPDPGWGKYDPRLLIPIEKLGYLIRLKERCLASATAATSLRTLEQLETMVDLIESACDANGLNGMIDKVKCEVRYTSPIIITCK